MTVKCPVRARWRINCTISGLIVTTERGNSQFEFCYKIVISFDKFSHRVTFMFQSKRAVYHKVLVSFLLNFLQYKEVSKSDHNKI